MSRQQSVSRAPYLCGATRNELVQTLTNTLKKRSDFIAIYKMTTQLDDENGGQR